MKYLEVCIKGMETTFALLHHQHPFRALPGYVHPRSIFLKSSLLN